MRRFQIFIALLAIALVAIPGSSLGGARALPVIQLVSITTADRINDVAPKGPSKGDTEFTTSRLLNAVPQFGKRRGAAVGSDRGTLTFQSGRSVTINGVAKLPGGTLVVHGKVRILANGLVLPVSGGTGAFRGAHGTVTTSPLTKDGKRALNVYRLKY
jgi:hypothetical protein